MMDEISSRVVHGGSRQVLLISNVKLVPRSLELSRFLTGAVSLFVLLVVSLLLPTQKHSTSSVAKTPWLASVLLLRFSCSVKVSRTASTTSWEQSQTPVI